MTNEEIIEQLGNAIDLIKQDGKDWLDDRDIPILEACIKSLTALDKLRAEIENLNVWGTRYNPDTDKDRKPQIVQKVKEHVIEIIDKYKAETEEQDGRTMEGHKRL